MDFESDHYFAEYIFSNIFITSFNWTQNFHKVQLEIVLRIIQIKENSEGRQ